jgi:hypothetical protein
MTLSRRSAVYGAAFVAILAAEGCGGGAAAPRDGAVDRALATEGGASLDQAAVLDRDHDVEEVSPDATPDDDAPGLPDATGLDSRLPFEAGADADGPPAGFDKRWVPLGAPSAGSVSALAIAADGTVFAGVGPILPFTSTIGTGLFTSRDSGVSWRPNNEGLRNFNIQDIALTEGTFFVATADVVRSVDGGRTWQQSLVSSKEFLTVAAGTGGRLAFASDSYPGGGLRRSEDGGLTWMPVHNPGATFTTNSIAVLGSVVLAFGDVGLSRSTDSGKTFTSVVGQMGLPFVNDVLPNLLCGGGHCYLAGLAANGAQDFLRSTDDGATWTSIGQTNYFPLALSDDGTVYVRAGAGLARSDDGGTTWTTLPGPPVTPAVLAAKGKNVFAGTSNGIFRSDDRGASWIPANGSVAQGALTTRAGLLVVDMSSTALSPNGDLYVGAPGVGFLRSVDDGASWSVVKVGFVPTSCVVTEAAGLMCIGSGGYLLTKDHGVTWQPWSVPALTDQSGSSFWTLGARGKTVYVSGKAAQAPLGKVARSDDGGLTFQLLMNSPEASQNIQVLANGHVLANSMYDTFRSIDDGVTWTKLAKSMDLPVTEGAGGILYRGYAGTVSGVERSTDEGDTWGLLDDHQTIQLFNGKKGPVWFDGAGTMYAAWERQSPFQSRVGPWTMYMSNDLGMHWAEFAAQLPHPVISMAALDKRGRLLLATNGGVYRLE